MGDFVAQGKGKVLDEIYVPLYPKPRISNGSSPGSRRPRPDVIFSTVVGSGTATLYRTYRAAGFDPTRMPIASLTTSEAEVAGNGRGSRRRTRHRRAVFRDAFIARRAAFRHELQGKIWR